MKEYEADTYGHLHPISHIIRQTAYIFSQIGFSVVSGPEVETEYYNFDALNIPAHHPARDLWDTLWLKPFQEEDSKVFVGKKIKSKEKKQERYLLRTHTSAYQVKYMQDHKPPFRI